MGNANDCDAAPEHPCPISTEKCAPQRPIPAQEQKVDSNASISPPAPRLTQTVNQQPEGIILDTVRKSVSAITLEPKQWKNGPQLTDRLWQELHRQHPSLLKISTTYIRRMVGRPEKAEKFYSHEFEGAPLGPDPKRLGYLAQCMHQDQNTKFSDELYIVLMFE